MTTQFTPNNMSLPPPPRWAVWDRRRAARRAVAPRRNPLWVPTRYRDASSASAIAYTAKFLLTGIAIVLGGALILTAPRTVVIPIGVVVGAGLVASWLVTAVVRWRNARDTVTARGRLVSAAHIGESRDVTRTRDDDPSDESMRELGWLALGVASIAMLLLALIVPRHLSVGLAGVGLAGLLVFRLTAAWAGWLPHGAPAGSPEPASQEPPNRSSPRLPSS